ncbi:SPOR domain-containing protein [Roseomonas gilardii subsp. gilardii]|uniref:SPOR domain-containing protein n=1 Tax=Roseomonas gilardii TaxID=257708 RepID=UPI001FFB488C|nr:SPOR domain-containing protein [Roseomonas gilardii]UPG71548.1 SPOR domain-containing protein [Roseomonas gilardii subsp. gilardii]
MLAVAGGLTAVLGVGAAAVWGVSRVVSNGVPVIEADSRPLRVRPDDPGGLRVANQGERIFETQNQPQRGRAGQPGVPAQAQIAPAPEQPNLEALRQAAQASRMAQRTAVPTAQPAATAPAVPPPVAEAPQAPAEAVTAPAANPAASPAPGARAPEPAPRQETRAEAHAEPARPAASGSALVQLGALGSEEAAHTEWNRLKGRLGGLLADRRPMVVRFERPGMPTMWRLRTGGFSDAAAARSFCEAARAKGAPACAAIGG